MTAEVVTISVKDALAIIGGIASAAAGLTWFVAAQFSKTRNLIHDLNATMNGRVARIEMHLYKRDDYQPGVDPLFNGGGRRHGHR